MVHTLVISLAIAKSKVINPCRRAFFDYDFFCVNTISN
jgi:hypothetical protein